MVGAFVLYLDLSADPDASRMQTDRFPLPVIWTIFASVLLGMGLGTQLALLWSNWHRLRAVLRPNKVRVICCIVLVMLAPFAHIFGIPVPAGLAWFGVFKTIFTDRTFSEIHFDEYSSMASTVLFIVYPPLFYVFSCLIISGVRQCLLRILVFGQIWLAAYGAVLMIFGFYSGNM